MTEIKIISIDYKPCIRILGNYIITFINKTIELFDFKGFKLDSLECDLNKYISDICIIHNNLFIAIAETDLLEIYINNNKLEIKNLF